MKIVKFEYFSNSSVENNDIFYDSCSEIRAWSRIYEYPYVYNFIKDKFKNKQKIHNTCWGLDNTKCHVKFKNVLEDQFGIENVTNSDIKRSNLNNTEIYDVTKKEDNYKERFDYVVNISAIEEIKFDHLSIVKNLYSQVNENGYLILTFDLPGLQLSNIENFLNMKIDQVETVLNGSNSIIEYSRYSHLNCGVLIIQK